MITCKMITFLMLKNIKKRGTLKMDIFIEYDAKEILAQ